MVRCIALVIDLVEVAWNCSLDHMASWFGFLSDKVLDS